MPQPWHDKIHYALAELYPTLNPPPDPMKDYQWVTDHDTGEPYMFFWNQDRLGVLDLGAIEDKALEILARPPKPPTTPTVVAIAELKVVDEEFTGIETSTGLAAAMFLDTGLAWVFFLTPQPSANYLTFVQSSGCNVDVTDRQEDYFEVTTTDRATNQPVTPTNLSISVQRVT